MPPMLTAAAALVAVALAVARINADAQKSHCKTPEKWELLIEVMSGYNGEWVIFT